MSVVHPNKEFVKRLALYFPFRANTMHNFKSQIKLNKKADFLDGLHFSSKDKRIKENVDAMRCNESYSV